MRHRLSLVLLTVVTLGTSACRGSQVSAQVAAPPQDPRLVELVVAEADPAEDANSIWRRPVRRDASDALALLPDTTAWAVSVDLLALAERAVWRDALLGQMFMGTASARKLKAFQDCGYSVEMLRRVTVGGGTPEARGQAAFGEELSIIDGVAIADLAKVKCVLTALGPGSDQSLLVEDGPGFTRVLDPERFALYLVGRDRLVISDPSRQQQTQDMLAGRGAQAVRGSLREALVLTDIAAPMFSMMALSDQERTSMGSSAAPLGELLVLSATLTWLHDGVQINAQFALPSERLAAEARDFLRSEYNQIRPMAGLFGIPQAVADGVTFANAGQVATISMDISGPELEAIARKIEEMSGGVAVDVKSNTP